MFWDKKPASPLNEAVIRDALGHPDWLLGVRLGPNGRVTAVIAARNVLHDNLAPISCDAAY